MPTDRVTELLWNYLALAQIADHVRVWGTGPALSRPPAAADLMLPSGGDVAAWADPSDGARTATFHNGTTSPAGNSYGTAGQGLHASFSTVTPPTSLAAGQGISLQFWSGQSHDPAVLGSGSAGVHVATGGYSPGPNILNSRAGEHPSVPAHGGSQDSGPDPDPSIDLSHNVQLNKVLITTSSGAHSGPTVVLSTDAGRINDGALQAFHGAEPGGVAMTYVAGDLHTHAELLQQNILFDQDVSHQHLTGAMLTSATGDQFSVVQSIADGANRASNTGELSARLPDFDAVFVRGDYVELNRIVQVNLTIDQDTDLIRHDSHLDGGDAAGSTGVVSGGNGQFNTGSIIDDGGSGAIRIVGHSYSESFSATQLNYLFDADTTILSSIYQQALAASSTLGELGSLQGGRNMQVNSAEFLQHEAVMATAADASDAWLSFAQALDRDPFGVQDLAGLHGAGGSSLKVLFVDGNFYVQNLIVQINVVVDGDDSRQEIIGQFQLSSDDGRFDFTNMIGHAANNSENAAIMIDHEQPFHLMVVEGSYAEVNQIDQINILFDDDHQDSSLVLSRESSGGPHDGPYQHALPSSDSGTDVLHRAIA